MGGEKGVHTSLGSYDWYKIVGIQRGPWRACRNIYQCYPWTM